MLSKELPLASSYPETQIGSPLSSHRECIRRISLNYVIDQTTSGSQHAGSKARDDVNDILVGRGFEKKTIECSYDSGLASIVIDSLSIPRQLSMIAKRFHEGDSFVLQFPFRCYSEKTVRDLCNAARIRKTNSIILVHDLPCLYRIGGRTRTADSILRNDVRILSHFDRIISHNASMSDYLVKHGLSATKLVEIDLFDYLVPASTVATPHFARKVSIASNLTRQKAGYAYKLQEIAGKEYRVDLYGMNWEGSESQNGVFYHGSIDPDQLPSYVNEGFGLVWDGDSTEECSGDYGVYLHYNNPHKLSSYIACGVPVIVWSEAAVAPFVEKNKIGVAVSSLSELNSLFKNMTESRYIELANNVAIVRERVIKGKFLSSAVDKALATLQGNLA